MPTVIFKRFRTSDKIELEFDNLEELSVEEVRKKVSSSMELPTEDFATVDATVSQDSTRLLENRRVLAMIARIIGSPGLLQTILQGTSLGDNSAIRGIVDSPDLMASFSDPDTIQEYIRSNPPVASAMEEFIRQVLGPGFDETDYEEQGLVNMLEGFLDDQISVMEEGDDDDDDDEEEEEEEVQLALAQEQMFEHSQALQAHYQQQQQQPQPHVSSAAGAPLQQETTYNQAASLQHGSLLRPTTESVGGITREQLASALAAAMDATPITPVPPQEGSRSGMSSSGPSHLNVPHGGGGGGSAQAGTLYNVPGEPPRPPHPTPFSSMQASRSSSNPGHAASHSGGHAPTGPITPEALQQALSSIAAGNPLSQQPPLPPPPDYQSRDVWSSAPNTSASNTQGTRQGGYGRVQENLSALAQTYSEQLEQLHRMGILDDAACLQALAATDGDIMAALEILYTQ